MAALMEEYGNREAELVCDLLLEQVTGWSRIDRINNATVPLSKPQLERLEEGIRKLELGMPIQYVTGEAWFGEMRFSVSPAVLIPRPETDELVHWILAEYKSRTEVLTLTDIGTGSGCIPIVCKKKRRAWSVYGCDISADALDIAKQNARDLETTVQFLQLNILNEESWNSIPLTDVLVSNPPYIPEKEKSSLQRQVQEFEPGLALFVPDNDPLLFYRAIAKLGKAKLKSGGSVYLECHEDYATETVSMLRDEHYNQVELKKDMQGRERMLCAKRHD